MAMERVAACACCPCCHNSNKSYTFSKPAPAETVTVQPLSSQKFGEDGRPLRRPGSQSPATQGQGNQSSVIQGPGSQNQPAQSSATQGPGNRSPVSRGPGNQNPPAQGPGNQISATQGPGNRSPVSQGPGNQNQPDQGPGNGSPVSQGPGNHNQPDQGTGNRSSVSQGSGDHNQPDQGPGNRSPVSQGPGNQNQPDQSPGNQSSTIPNHGYQKPGTQGQGNQSASAQGAGTQKPGVDIEDDPNDIPPPLPTTPPPSMDPQPSSEDETEPQDVIIISSEAPGSGGPDVLMVREVDMCVTTNGSEHHTSHYELMSRPVNPQLVIRRGQPFQLDVVLSRAYDSKLDAVSFIFTLAESEKPSYGHGTLIAVPLLAKAPPNEDSWTAVLQRSSENVISVHVTPPPQCVVGVWKMDIDTKLMNDGAFSYSHKTKIYILFNAWCKKDQVYMKEEDRRNEFVETDTGLIWRGSYNRMRPCIWNYAQFEKDILDCSLYLMTKIGRVPLPSCNDPVKVTRALSAAVNSPDDNGAIMGNWTAEFDGGTPPTKWVGSQKILQKFYSNKKPVKYGQCWVFSGVLTTVCRALGIPTRTITTYSSAHDTQNSLTVDYFVDEKGEIMEELTSDSIWNFHVWNEVWMRRPDLEPGDYDGWSVIDATPQEMSDDMFRCGPTSVKAVKRGEVLKPYDTAFVFAEVNADKVFWRYSGPTQPLKLLRKDMHGIGQYISTKAVGKWTREDITMTYKHPEKSDEERTAMLKALKQSESLFSRYYLNEEFNDVRFDFKLRDDIVIGSPFSTVVVVNNRSKDKDYTVSVILRVDTVLYTGKVQESVRKDKFDMVVKRRTEEEVKLDITYKEYAGKLVDQCAFNIACLATVQDTNYEYFAQDDFRVRKPDIKFHIDGTPAEGQELTATASFINPLPVSLKKGKFLIEGPSLETPLKIKLEHFVEPKSEAKVTFKATPKFAGKTTIAAKFYSTELEDVDGFIVFMVGEKAPGDSNGLSNNI